MMQDISVIICAYTEKRWDELVAAVESVQRQTLQPREIIAVIDHNPDLFLRAQRTLSGVIIIENHGDKGLSGARNSGWTAAIGEIVAFLDDDAVAQPNWLENLAVCYTGPEVMGVGGKIIPLWEVNHPRWFPEEFNWVIGCTYRGMPGRNAPIRNLIGANMSMRRTILAAEGGFRESFGCDKGTNPTRGIQKWFNHYAGDEETEFCIRASQHHEGSTWLYTALAAIQHRVSAGRTRWSYFLWRCYDEGLGKASLVRLHTSSTALSTERTYTFKVLPKGIIRGLVDTFLLRDLAGVFQAIAIVIGLAVTAVGYFIGSISSRITDSTDADLTPMRHHRTMEVSPPSRFSN